MSLSVRTRFEVFKRDRFTCQYCGKNPPDVLLEVDHITPRAAGGSDEMANLTTACWDCNRGKADRLLEEGTEPVVGAGQVDSLRERLEQAAAYTELVGQQEALVDKQVRLVMGVWAKAFGAEEIEEDGQSFWRLASGEFPNERSVRIFVRRLPVHEIMAAIDITSSRHHESTAWTCRFFYKVCWRRIKGETGPIDEPKRKVVETDPTVDSDPENEWRAIAERAEETQIADRSRIIELLDQVDDLEDQIRDLKVTIRRLREEAGRDE